MSTSLVQLLHALHPSELRQSTPTRWSSSISFSARLALYNHASQAYGANISFKKTERDDYVFNRWLRSGEGEDLEITPQIKEILENGNFTPFPLSLDVTSADGEAKEVRRFDRYIEQALCHAPALAPCMLAQGEKLSADADSNIQSDSLSYIRLYTKLSKLALDVKTDLCC